MQNMLTKKPTNWKFWYAFIPLITFPLPSFAYTVLSSTTGEGGLFAKLFPAIQFFLFLLLSFGVLRLFTKKATTASDMGYDTKFWTKKNIITILIVFVTTHLLFYVLGKMVSTPADMKSEFLLSGYGKGLLTDLIFVISTTILAPVIEELIYRGIMFRAVNDSVLRKFPNSTSLFGIPAIAAIIFAALAFILPHVSNLGINIYTIAYFATSAGFSIVYLVSGNMTAAMVSHSLQSAVAGTQLLYFGKGDYALSPIVMGISILCPVIVYFIGTAIGKIRYRN